MRWRNGNRESQRQDQSPKEKTDGQINGVMFAMHADSDHGNGPKHACRQAHPVADVSRNRNACAQPEKRQNTQCRQPHRDDANGSNSFIQNGSRQEDAPDWHEIEQHQRPNHVGKNDCRGVQRQRGPANQNRELQSRPALQCCPPPQSQNRQHAKRRYHEIDRSDPQVVQPSLLHCPERYPEESPDCAGIKTGKSCLGFDRAYHGTCRLRAL